jgi:hypothetical protein
MRIILAKETIKVASIEEDGVIVVAMLPLWSMRVTGIS